MEKKWTPGPWVLDEEEFLVAKDRIRLIAAVSCFHDNQEEVANAVLMSVSPELYDALEDMVSLWEKVHPGVLLGKPTLLRAKRAMAKARGENAKQETPRG